VSLISIKGRQVEVEQNAGIAKSPCDKFLFYPPWSAIFSCDRDGRPQICAASISHLGREGFAAALFLFCRGVRRARAILCWSRWGLTVADSPAALHLISEAVIFLLLHSLLSLLSLFCSSGSAGRLTARAAQTSLTTRCISERLRLTPCKQAALLPCSSCSFCGEQQRQYDGATPFPPCHTLFYTLAVATGRHQKRARERELMRVIAEMTK
jgi:hypothetical protein